MISFSCRTGYGRSGNRSRCAKCEADGHAMLRYPLPRGWACTVTSVQAELNMPSLRESDTVCWRLRTGQLKDLMVVGYRLPFDRMNPTEQKLIGKLK